MKTFFAWIFAFWFLSPLSSFAGAVSGGGGRAVVCRDPSNHILSAQMLDLYEAETIFDLHLGPEMGTNEEAIAWAIDKINRPMWHYQVSISEAVIEKDFRQKIHFIPDGENLEPVEDSGEPVVPANCKIEQVANYHQSGQLFIKKEIWNAFSPMNRAALTVHEIAYLQARTRGQLSSSYYVRRFVGLIFSDTQLASYESPRHSTGSRHCTNPDSNYGLNISYDFDVIPRACDAWDPSPLPCYRVVFSYLKGQVVYDKTELEPVAANDLGRILDPTTPYKARSAQADLQSQIFAGTRFFYIVQDGGGERIPRVLLYENTDKDFVDLKCELYGSRQSQKNFSRRKE